jgi:hypothetical protein
VTPKRLVVQPSEDALPTLQVTVDKPAVAVSVEAGREIVLRGAFHSTHDGSVIDAASTTWPEGAPGGASVDPGGLVDFAGGGFHVTKLDAERHEVRAVATGDPAPACELAGVSSPCLALRLEPQARTRLLTMAEWRSSLKGSISLEIPAMPVPPVAPRVVRPPVPMPVLALAGAALALVLVALMAMRARARRRASPAFALAELCREVERRLADDAVLGASLARPVKSTLTAVKSGRVDASSPEGLRVRRALELALERLRDKTQRVREAREREAADELVGEMEAALEAAEAVDEAPVARLAP